jgi:hypothetical protein
MLDLRLVLKTTLPMTATNCSNIEVSCDFEFNLSSQSLNQIRNSSLEIKSEFA